MKKILLIAILLFFVNNIFAQSKILVQNSKNNSIEIKCFIQTIISEKGLNYYRKAEGEKKWTLLNSKPIFVGTQKISQKELNKDKDLPDFVSVANDLDPNVENGLLGIMLLIKSIQNSSFAKYLGIMYEDSNVKKGTTYKYKVTSVDKSGKELVIAYSEKITFGDFVIGYPPKEIIIKPSENEISIKWTPELSRYFGVNIYRKNNNTGKFFKVNKKPVMVSKIKNEDGEKVFPEFFFIEDSLNNNEEYEYKLNAVDYFGNISSFSEIIKVMPYDMTPPPPPRRFDKITRKEFVTLTWQYENNKDAIGFNIYRSTDDENYLKINSELINIETREYLLTEPVPGGFYYIISAVDEVGNEGKSSKLFVEVKDLIPPLKPKNLIAKSDTGLISLNWNKNIEKDLWGYLIYRRIENKKNDDFVLLNSNPISNNYYTDTLAKNARNKFEYSVVAIDSAYNKSEYSMIASARLPDIISPTKPVIKRIVKNDKTILIEWIPNVEPDLLGYNIYRIQNTNSESFERKMNINIIKKGINRFTDRDFDFNVEYKYYIIAIDTSNNKSKPSSYYSFTYSKKNEVKLQFKKCRGINKNKNNKLSWEVNGEDIKGYIVFKKNGNGFVPISGLINDNRYTEKNITQNGVYKYKIHAYSTKGNEIISKEISINVD